ncbi:MAG: adenine phosphoribosyltransferase [Armatimonadetes bacterium]|nr:adenine phosphoribosyltransferase [Anaerolineae bacterium]
MSDKRYPITIAGVERELPIFEVAPGVKIAILNILGDTKLVTAASRALAELLRASQPDVLVTPETKSIPLAHCISEELLIPYVVLRKSYKPYMGNALHSETLSITTGTPQMLYLDEKDQVLVAGKRVAIIDDVISTGSTLQGMRSIMDKAAATVVVEAAILTEGERAKWSNIIALGHVPVWINGEPQG